MQINRYSKPTPAQYNPMGLEELMMVPMQKRRQHDQLNQNIATTRTALAQADYMDMHDEEVSKTKQKLEKELARQVDQVSSGGINDTLRTDFMNLNADYQGAVGPKGIIGKASAAKLALDTEKNTYMQNSTALGYSPDDMAKNWEEFQQNYEQNSAETGKITNIGSLYSPNYKNVVTEFNKLADRVGLTSTDVANLNSSIKREDDGTYVLNEGDSNITASNESHLQAAADWMTRNINDPNSEIGKSIAHQRLSPQDAINQITGLNKIYETNKTGESHEKTISSYTPNKNTESSADAYGTGLTASAEQYMPTRYNDMSYSEISANISELEGSEAPEDRVELSKLNHFKEGVQKDLEQNAVFNTLSTELTGLEQDFEDIQKGVYNFSEDTSYKLINAKGFLDQGQGERIARDAATKALVNKINRTSTELDDITEKTTQGMHLKATSYQLTPVTSEQVTIHKNMESNFNSLIRDNPSALYSLGDITEVVLDGEVENQMTDNDKKEISKLFYASDPGDTELVNVTAQGLSGNPEYTIRLNNKKGASYDLDNPGLLDTRGNVGGEDQPIQIKIAFKETTTGGTKNFNGLLYQYLSSIGEEGAEMAESMELSRTFKVYEGQTWQDIEDSGALEHNESLKAIRAQKLEDMGITPTSSDRKFKEKLLELSKQTLTDL